MLKLSLNSYNTGTQDVGFAPDIVKIDDIEFSFDGGRLHVYCNGKEVVSTHFAGIDFNLRMELK